MQQHPSSLDPMREVHEIINSYNPNHPDYKFRAYFYNVIKDPRMRVKPQNVSERKWRELLDAVGGENNPEFCGRCSTTASKASYAVRQKRRQR